MSFKSELSEQQLHKIVKDCIKESEDEWICKFCNRKYPGNLRFCPKCNGIKKKLKKVENKNEM